MCHYVCTGVEIPLVCLDCISRAASEKCDSGEEEPGAFFTWNLLIASTSQRLVIQLVSTVGGR